MEVPFLDKMEFWTGIGGLVTTIVLIQSYRAGSKKASAETAKIEKETEVLQAKTAKDLEDQLYSNVFESIQRILDIHTKNAITMEANFDRIHHDMEVLRNEKERLSILADSLGRKNEEQTRTIHKMQERLNHFTEMAEKACEACRENGILPPGRLPPPRNTG